MEEKDLKTFMHKIYSISNKVQQIRGTDYMLNSGIKINTAALSTLKVISQCNGKNMTEIGMEMGVTKGAISQMVLKLEKKGLVQKNRSEHNDKNYFITLTHKGTEALNEYDQMRDMLYHGMSEVLSHYQKEEIEVIWNFLCQTNQLMGKYKSYASYKVDKTSDEIKNCDLEFLNKEGE